MIFGVNTLPEYLRCGYVGELIKKAILDGTRQKQGRIVGEFFCKGYDTIGPFKLIGGISKGHPDKNDPDNAKAFFKGLEKCI